jgi:hypothetical protein
MLARKDFKSKLLYLDAITETQNSTPLLALWAVDHERHRTSVPPNPRSSLACATNRVDESESDLHTTAEIPAERASFSIAAPALFVNINKGKWA